MQVSALVHCCMKKSISVPSCPQSVLAVMTLQHWEVRWEVCRQKSVFGSLFFPHGRAPRCPRITQNDATERKSKGKKLLRLPGEVTFFPVNVKELQVPRSHTSKIQREGARPGVVVLQ